MKRTNRFLSLILLASFFGQAHGMNDTLVMAGRSVISPESLGRVALLFKDGAYSAVRNGVTQGINSFDVSPILRSANTAKLITLVKAGGALALTKMSNGDLRLALAPCLKGGGPLSAAFGYVAVKGVAYATIICASVGLGAATIASGGLPAVAMGGMLTIAPAAVGVPGAAILAGELVALSGPAIITASTLTTTGIVTGAGGIVGAAAALEGAACAVSTALLACPFLP